MRQDVDRHGSPLSARTRMRDAMQPPPWPEERLSVPDSTNEADGRGESLSSQETPSRAGFPSEVVVDRPYSRHRPIPQPRNVPHQPIDWTAVAPVDRCTSKMCRDLTHARGFYRPHRQPVEPVHLLERIHGPVKLPREFEKAGGGACLDQLDHIPERRHDAQSNRGRRIAPWNGVADAELDDLHVGGRTDGRIKGAREVWLNQLDIVLEDQPGIKLAICNQLPCLLVAEERPDLGRRKRKWKLRSQQSGSVDHTSLRCGQDSPVDGINHGARHGASRNDSLHIQPPGRTVPHTDDESLDSSGHG